MPTVGTDRDHFELMGRQIQLRCGRLVASPVNRFNQRRLPKKSQCEAGKMVLTDRARRHKETCVGPLVVSRKLFELVHNH